MIKNGDILVSTVRPNLNGVAAVTEDFDGATASTGFCVLRPRPEKLSSNYLMHWVRSPQFIELMVKQATGASYPAVSDRIVKGSPIPLPPLDEQRRIAEILDKADALRRKRRKMLSGISRLRASQFNEFMQGESSWPIASLGEVTKRITVGHVGPTSPYFRSEGVPFLRTGNIGSSEIDDGSMAFVTPEFHARLSKSVLRADDVVVSRVISDEIRCAIIPPKYDGANCANVILVRPGQKILPEYIVHFIRSPAVQRSLLKRQVGSAQSVVNTKVLQNMAIPLPPVDQQRQFAALIEMTRKVELGCRSCLEKLEALFSSLQHRAFSGQL